MPTNLRAKANGAERTSGSHVKGLALTVMIDRLQLEEGLATRSRRTPRSVSVVANVPQSYGVRQIQTELATGSDECAPRKRRAEARSLTQPQLSLHETF